jgi:hypothetical protein
MVDNLFLSLSERLLGGCDMYTLGPAISFDRDGGENHAFSLWLDGWMAGWAPSSFLWRNRQGEFQPVCNQLKALIMDEPYRSLSPLLLMYIWGVSSCCYSKGLLNQSGRRSQRKRMSSHERRPIMRRANRKICWLLRNRRANRNGSNSRDQPWNLPCLSSFPLIPQ